MWDQIKPDITLGMFLIQYILKQNSYVRLTFMSVGPKRMNAFHSNFNLTNFNHLEINLLLRVIYMIISVAADKAVNTSSLKIKSHNINSLCVRHNPEPFKHI